MDLYSHWLEEFGLFSIIRQVDRSPIRWVTILPSVQDVKAFIDFSTLSAQHATPHNGEERQSGLLHAHFLLTHPLSDSQWD